MFRIILSLLAAFNLLSFECLWKHNLTLASLYACHRKLSGIVAYAKLIEDA
jgi:hypothetical protein